MVYPQQWTNLSIQFKNPDYRQRQHPIQGKGKLKIWSTAFLGFSEFEAGRIAKRCRRRRQ